MAYDFKSWLDLREAGGKLERRECRTFVRIFDVCSCNKVAHMQRTKEHQGLLSTGIGATIFRLATQTHLKSVCGRRVRLRIIKSPTY